MTCRFFCRVPRALRAANGNDASVSAVAVDEPPLALVIASAGIGLTIIAAICAMLGGAS